MYIIVGLGNPGDKYKHTRHNIGFDALDKIAKDNGIAINEKKFKAEYGKGLIAGQKVILAKPQTYMNLSGESVREIVDYFKVDETSELIVIYDDISLDVGKLRIRKKGSAGGHNGIKNIILNLATDVFVRIKVGVGDKPKNYDLADYVLGHFSKEEESLLDDSFDRIAKAVETIILNGPDAAMNNFN